LYQDANPISLFLRESLEKDPERPYWEAATELSYASGSSTAMEKLLYDCLAKKSLSHDVKKEVWTQLIRLHLANGEIEKALQYFPDLLAGASDENPMFVSLSDPNLRISFDPTPEHMRTTRSLITISNDKPNPA